MTNRPKPRPATTSSWDIYLARHMPAKWLGTVEATDADAAIEQAVKEFDVTNPKTLMAGRRREPPDPHPPPTAPPGPHPRAGTPRFGPAQLYPRRPAQHL